MRFCGWLGNGEVFAHFVEAFLADAFDGEEVVDTFEGTVGFSGVENFLGGGGADAGDLLEFGGGGGVEIDGVGRRLLFGQKRSWKNTHAEQEQKIRQRS